MAKFYTDEEANALGLYGPDQTSFYKNPQNNDFTNTGLVLPGGNNNAAFVKTISFQNPANVATGVGGDWNMTGISGMDFSGYTGGGSDQNSNNDIISGIMGNASKGLPDGASSVDGTTASDGQSKFNGWMNFLGSSATGLPSGNTGTNNPGAGAGVFGPAFADYFQRGAIIILGLVFVGAGLYMFKPDMIALPPLPGGLPGR